MLSSPYTSCPVTLRIGLDQKTYYVPQNRLQLLGSVASTRSWNGSIHLADADACTSHVLVHYLYTGAYQTLDNMEQSPPEEEANVEFKRAFLAYTMANQYKLLELQDLAKQQIKHFGAEMDIFRVVEVVRGVFAKLGDDDAWFRNYLEGKAKSAFEEDYTVFSSGDLFDRIEDVGLARLMATFMVRLYSEKVELLMDAGRERDATAAEEGDHEVQDFAIEEVTPDECGATEVAPTDAPTDAPADAPADASSDECCAAIDAPADASSDECCATTEECWPEACDAVPAEECQSEECDSPAAPVEECWSEACDAVPIEECQSEEFDIPAAPVEECWSEACDAVPAEECQSEEFDIPAAPAEECWLEEWGATEAAAPEECCATEGNVPEECTSDVQDLPIEEPKVEELQSRSPPEPEPEVDEPSPAPLAEPEPEVDNWRTAIWGSGKKKEGKKYVDEPPPPAPEEPAFESEEPNAEPDEPPLMPEEPMEVEDGICSVRAKHLLGDEWKNCRKCRAILRQVAIQIASLGHANEVGYVMVDQALMG